MVKEFGPAFAAELFKLQPGGWRGPVQSGYGWHLVWIDSMEACRVPTFEEVETDVRSAWLDARYKEVKLTALEEMRSRYTVVVVDLSDLKSPEVESALSESIPQ